MKKEDLPQDKTAITNIFREVCYVKDKDGNYTTDLSTGWNVKADALDNAWNDIKEKVEQARLQVKANQQSPILYFMELKLMDVSLLSSYTGFWKFTIRRHLQPSVFKTLSDKKLSIYAKAFDITTEELKKFKG